MSLLRTILSLIAFGLFFIWAYFAAEAREDSAMTEDEAKKKFCPQTFNTEAGWDTCIASQCMAWRTTQVGRVLPGDEYQTYQTEGYCGLAGAPQ